VCVCVCEREREKEEEEGNDMCARVFKGVSSNIFFILIG